MKRFALVICFVVALVQAAAAQVEWVTSVSTALDRARAENKTVLLDFTGSDWCPWCIKLKSEVFDQPEFANYAKANLIMVEVDFPRNKPQSPEQSASNQKLAQTYQVRGYPTVVLVNGFGVQIGRGGYVEGGPKNFIASLERNPAYAHHPAPVAGAAPAGKPADAVSTPKAPITQYGDLTLKGVSGAGNRRMVLINDSTLMTGETARVKSHDKRIQITVKEIHDDSVIILVDGKLKELILGEPAKLAAQ